MDPGQRDSITNDALHYFQASDTGIMIGCMSRLLSKQIPITSDHFEVGGDCFVTNSMETVFACERWEVFDDFLRRDLEPCRDKPSRRNRDVHHEASGFKNNTLLDPRPQNQ